MAYLKALGILRLVAEQKDQQASGWWSNEVFWLRSTLDKEALVKFFLEGYKPTPVVAPWAGGSGFFRGDNTVAKKALCNSREPRCKPYSETIQRVRRIIKEERITDKPKDADKVRLIQRFRQELPDEAVAWMDAAVVLYLDGQGFSPLLGTGGNDGRLDFTQNFMQRIVVLGLHENGNAGDQSRMWINHALFALPVKLRGASVGQFSPGRAGGANATQGMEGASADNPWDFVLMLEGTPVTAGAAAKRFDAGVAHSGATRAAFPFTVRTIAAGFDSLAAKDEGESRGELWLPLWSRPSTVGELRQLFGEGRADVSGRPARGGTDFARAVASFGVDRGVELFSRFGFLKRSGKAFLATPLGRFEVAGRPGIALLREVDNWLDALRRAIGGKNVPPRFMSALRAIDSAIFGFCKYGGRPLFQKILMALGRAERELSRDGEAGRIGDASVKPLGGLSSAWADAANDGSGEFSLALALASIYDSERKIGPLRANLEPADWMRNAWTEKNRSVVWNAARLEANMANVLERRMMDGQRNGCTQLALESYNFAPLEMISQFLARDLDDNKVEDLIWGLMLLGPRSRKALSGSTPGSLPLPREYALLKLLFLPRPLVAERIGKKIEWRLAFGPNGDGRSVTTVRPEPRILPLLRCGRIGDACVIAARRLRVSGLPSMPGPVAGVPRDGVWREANHTNPRSDYGQNLAAAMLIPISSKSVNDLIHLVCRADESAAAQTPAVFSKGESE